MKLLKASPPSQILLYLRFVKTAFENLKRGFGAGLIDQLGNRSFPLHCDRKQNLLLEFNSPAIFSELKLCLSSERNICSLQLNGGNPVWNISNVTMKTSLGCPVGLCWVYNPPHRRVRLSYIPPNFRTNIQLVLFFIYISYFYFFPWNFLWTSCKCLSVTWV